MAADVYILPVYCSSVINVYKYNYILIVKYIKRSLMRIRLGVLNTVMVNKTVSEFF